MKLKRKYNGALPTKTFSDSTLRYVRQVAVNSDIDCMPGGTTGNVLNAVDIDEASKNAKNILLVAGANERHRPMNPSEFSLILDTTSERIEKLGKDKNVVILPPPRTNYFDSLDQAKQEMSMVMLQELDNKDGITVLENPIEEYEDDGGRHPSAAQTAELLQFVNKKFQELFNIPYTVTSATGQTMVTNRIYSGVESVYIFGCAACNNRKQNKWHNLCEECSARTNSERISKITTELLKRAKEIMDDEMPSLGTYAASEKIDTTLDSHKSHSNGDSSNVSADLSPPHATDKGDGRDRSPLKAESVKTPPPSKRTNFIPPPPSKVKYTNVYMCSYNWELCYGIALHFVLYDTVMLQKSGPPNSNKLSFFGE